MRARWRTSRSASDRRKLVVIIFSGCAGRKGFAVPVVGKAEDGGCVPRSGSVRAVRTKLRWTAGTIFQDTRTPLKVWFHALWWMTSQKNGVSALGLQRVLGLVAPGSVVHTDGWLGYLPLDSKGYRRQITVLRGQRHPSELLPRVHRVISLLKRWLLGTHQGAVRLEHVDDYLNEFTFRFNRRRSRSRGKLFFRLVQQAMAVEPST